MEIIVKKSKFLGFTLEVFSPLEINVFLEKLKKEHKKATHICYAYKIISKGIESVKYFDDGEPSGTAGRPIFNVIEKKKLFNIAIFVVRYFGGIKLGTGGLVRAYSKCAAETINQITE